MSPETRNLITVVSTAVATVAASYIGLAKPAIEKVDDDARSRHLVSCGNAAANRALARDIAEGLLEPLPVPADADPGLQRFIELSNEWRAKQKELIVERTRVPVECSP